MYSSLQNVDKINLRFVFWGNPNNPLTYGPVLWDNFVELCMRFLVKLTSN